MNLQCFLWLYSLLLQFQVIFPPSNLIGTGFFILKHFYQSQQTKADLR